MRFKEIGDEFARGEVRAVKVAFRQPDAGDTNFAYGTGWNLVFVMLLSKMTTV